MSDFYTYICRRIQVNNVQETIQATSGMRIHIRKIVELLLVLTITEVTYLYLISIFDLEIIRQEKTTRETSQAMERRPAHTLTVRHDLAEDST